MDLQEGRLRTILRMDAATREAEYQICQRRGHKGNGTILNIGWESWEHCRWCGTSFRYETTRKLIESNVPAPQPVIPTEPVRPDAGHARRLVGSDEVSLRPRKPPKLQFKDDET
jgi:hypothetical protein